MICDGDEMNKCKYSVIVPVYKVEAVLPRCIESILNQTVPDFELILIDDGSPDRSGAICDEYAAKDARIRVIHQENGGVSKARNAGLDAAQGQYVVFVDSDDYVCINYLEELDGDDVDLVVSGTIVYEPDGRIRTTISEQEETKVILSEDDRMACLTKWYSMQVFGKRFKRELIDFHNLRFDISLNFGEDTIFMAEYLLLIQNVRTRREATYNYSADNPESLTQQAKNGFFGAYCAIQTRLIDIFSAHLILKKYVVDKLYWVIENELIRISKSEMTNAEQNRSIRAILRAPYMNKCLKLYKNKMPLVFKIAFKIKSPELIEYLFRRN